MIAETTDLPTRYIKEVVTDDRGRYLIPDLPKAKYTVWARGYGLVDSPKVETEPGKLVDLKPSVAPDAKTAAQYYPAELLVRAAQGAREERISGHRARPAMASRRTSRTRASGCISSRPTVANHATSSAASTPARFPRCSPISIRLRRRGCAACSRDRRAAP